MPHQASALVLFGIPFLAIGVVAVAILLAARKTRGADLAARRAPFVVLLLFLVSGALAASGVLANPRIQPPAMMPLMIASVVLSVIAARSALGGVSRPQSRSGLSSVRRGSAFRSSSSCGARRTTA